MSSLGQILLERSWITEHQLEQAIERQQQLGGRLGTCILELGFLSEETLLEALSTQLGAPTATSEDLAAIPPEALSLLPKKTAIRSRAIPFRASANTVDLAMLDVGDLTLEDEISFIISKRVRFHVATELRLVEALARYYGCNIPLRLSTLARQLSLAAEGGAAAPSPGDRQDQPPVKPFETASAAAANHGAPDIPPRRPLVPRAMPEAPTSIPLTDDERAALSQVREPDETRRPDGIGSTTPLEVFTMDLVRAETSTDIGNALLQVLSRHFVRVLLFRASGSRQEITGWLAEGPDIDADWFYNFSIGLRQNTVFREVESTRSVFVGRLQNHPSHRALSRCWGNSLEYECLLMPVFVRERLVCVAYCDRSSLGLENLELEHIQKLGAKAALAFERCILRRKLQSA